VQHGMEYVDPGASSYETRYRARVIDNLHRRAKAFGFVLQPSGANAGLPFVVPGTGPQVHPSPTRTRQQGIPRRALVPDGQVNSTPIWVAFRQTTRQQRIESESNRSSNVSGMPIGLNTLRHAPPSERLRTAVDRRGTMCKNDLRSFQHSPAVSLSTGLHNWANLMAAPTRRVWSCSVRFFWPRRQPNHSARR
jgi:hypothetical protein